MFRKLLDFILMPYRAYKQRQAFKKRMKELRARDPFIYK